MNRKRIIIVVCLLVLLTVLSGCGKVSEAQGSYRGIDVASPDWVGKLDAAKNADQMLIVAAFSDDATDAWISLHEKQSDGSWHMIMTSPGFIGKNGLGKRPDAHRRVPLQPGFRHRRRSRLRDPLREGG